MEAGCTAVTSMVRAGHIGWTFYLLGREDAGRRARRGFFADADAACLDCRPRDLFLFRQTVVANQPNVLLPALEDRSGRVVAMAVSGRSTGSRDGPGVRRSPLPRAPRRLPHFLWNAFPCARFS